MVAALMPLALASPANCCFQAAKPAAELPHCAASAREIGHASMASAQAMMARRILGMLNSSFASRHHAMRRRARSKADREPGNEGPIGAARPSMQEQPRQDGDIH